MGIRQDLEAHLKTAMVDEGVVTASEVVVYAAGVDIIATPCVVINPSDPYLTVVTMKQEAQQVNLELYLIAKRADPASALNYLEDLRKVVTDALKTMAPAFRWVTFGGFGLTEIGGEPYASALLEVSTTKTDALGS